MGQKGLLIGFGILLMVILAGASYMNYKNKQVSQSQVAVEAPTPGEESSSQTGSIWDMLTSGEVQKCTFISTQEDSTTQGDVYMEFDMVAVTFITDQKDKTSTESHMIKSGQQVYTWTTASNTGVKFEIDPNLESSWIKGTSPEGLSSLSADTEYICEPWEKNEKVFEIPENVNFLDVTM